MWHTHIYIYICVYIYIYAKWQYGGNIWGISRSWLQCMHVISLPTATEGMVNTKRNLQPYSIVEHVLYFIIILIMEFRWLPFKCSFPCLEYASATCNTHIGRVFWVYFVKRLDMSWAIRWCSWSSLVVTHSSLPIHKNHHWSSVCVYRYVVRYSMPWPISITIDSYLFTSFSPSPLTCRKSH